MSIRGLLLVGVLVGCAREPAAPPPSTNVNDVNIAPGAQPNTDVNAVNIAPGTQPKTDVNAVNIAPGAQPTTNVNAVNIAPGTQPSTDVNTVNMRRLTVERRYRVQLRSLVLPIPLRKVHEWALRVESPDGQALRMDRVDVDGGMPAHGHGFPTRPKAEKHLGGGEVLVEGVKFNMQGRWRLSFTLLGPSGVDRVDFDLDLRDGAGAGLPDDDYVRLVRSLSLDALGPVPADPSNRLSLDPRAAKLGERLFFDRALGRGSIACASCHAPERFFTDGLARSKGHAEVARNAPTLVGSGYGKWFTWDGRRDSMWAQALTPVESADEMGSTRVEAVRHVLANARADYVALFGEPAALLAELPERAGPFGDAAARTAWSRLPKPTRAAVDAAYANIGKLLGAYQRTLRPTPSRFDRYAKALLAGDASADTILTADERAGLRLFLDDSRTQCLRCHNGPLLSNFGFHNADTGSTQPPYDLGRSIGVRAALIDPFNCAGPHSDAPRGACKELRFADAEHTGGRKRGAFKVPTLRNVAATGPYMHDGRFTTLAQVVEHYRHPTPPETSRHELARTDLSDVEAGQLVAFLGTLTGEPPAGPRTP